MTEKRDPTKEYESKKILPEKETDYFGWLESWFSSHNLSVHNCLQTCHSFEATAYWESGVNRFDTNKKSAMHHCIDYLIKNQDFANDTQVVLGAWDKVNKYTDPWEHAVHIFLFLLNAGVSINSRKLNPYDIHDTPLEYAIDNGANKAVLELLIKHGAYVNSFEYNGWTPLMTAAYKSNVDAVEVLVMAGADIDAFDERGETALHIAFDRILESKTPMEHYHDTRKIIDILLKAGSNPNIYNIFFKSCIETEKQNDNVHYREEKLGIGLEMAKLRNHVRQIALSFDEKQRSNKKFILPGTLIVNTLNERTQLDFETDCEINDRKFDAALDLLDDLVIHYYKHEPIPNDLIKKIEALELEIKDPLIQKILSRHKK
jgi:ankyrin repeat protein